MRFAGSLDAVEMRMAGRMDGEDGVQFKERKRWMKLAEIAWSCGVAGTDAGNVLYERGEEF